MIHALITGRIHGTPAQRTSQTGKYFVVASVRATAGNNEALFVSVIAFDEQPQAALLALCDGEAVSLSGALTPKVWTSKSGEARPSLDMVAHAALSAHTVARKRKATPSPKQNSESQFAAAAKAQAIGDLADDLPWDA